MDAFGLVHRTRVRACRCIWDILVILVSCMEAVPSVSDHVRGNTGVTQRESPPAQANQVPSKGIVRTWTPLISTQNTEKLANASKKKVPIHSPHFNVPGNAPLSICDIPHSTAPCVTLEGFVLGGCWWLQLCRDFLLLVLVDCLV